MKDDTRGATACREQRDRGLTVRALDTEVYRRVRPFIRPYCLESLGGKLVILRKYQLRYLHCMSYLPVV